GARLRRRRVGHAALHVARPVEEPGDREDARRVRDRRRPGQGRPRHPEVEARRDRIRYPNVVLYDELSRPEFGPVAATLQGGHDLVTEVSEHQVSVQGLFRLGTSFGIDATIVTSDLNFLRIFPYHDPGAISAGLIRLRPGVDPAAVRDALAA